MCVGGGGVGVIYGGSGIRQKVKTEKGRSDIHTHTHTRTVEQRNNGYSHSKTDISRVRAKNSWQGLSGLAGIKQDLNMVGIKKTVLTTI